mgnify:CR=1 FL=1
MKSGDDLGIKVSKSHYTQLSVSNQIATLSASIKDLQDTVKHLANPGVIVRATGMSPFLFSFL